MIHGVTYTIDLAQPSRSDVDASSSIRPRNASWIRCEGSKPVANDIRGRQHTTALPAEEARGPD